MATQRKQKRVLLVDLGASMGGVEAYLAGLAGILAGHAEVYALCVLPELEQNLQRRGVTVTRLPLLTKVRPLRFLLAFVVLTWLIVRHGIDVVQVNGFLESVLLLPARLLGREAIYTRHGPFEMDVFQWYRQPFKYLPRLISRYSAHMASRLVCVSETVGAVCRPLFPRDRVMVIPNWVAQKPPVPTRPQREGNTVRLLYVGRLERYKGLHLLLEALRGLPGVNLTVVGDGSYRAALESLAAGLDVTFAGFHHDIAQFYGETDIFVMPSMGPEGLPLVTLEAMSHGLPCVFSDLPVHQEITDNGRAALLFHSGEVADLRIKLEALLQDHALLTQLARRAYAMVEERYNESVAARAYLQLFALEG